jgi:hypothetical protein
MAFDELLADRVRTCLQQVAGVSEQKMFGGLAFMTGGHLAVGVYILGASVCWGFACARRHESRVMRSLNRRIGR